MRRLLMGRPAGAYHFSTAQTSTFTTNERSSEPSHTGAFGVFTGLHATASAGVPPSTIASLVPIVQPLMGWNM